MLFKHDKASINDRVSSWMNRAGRPQGKTTGIQPEDQGRHYFLGIAIDQYDDWPKLRNAKRDVQAFTELLLEEYGFRQSDIILLADKHATAEGIIRTLDGLVKLVTPKDSLVIYYAGHGHFDPITERGFWVPVNAKGKKTQELIRNSTIKDYIADIPSLHTLLISDSCFSGSLFVRGFQRDGSLSANELMRLPSRWAICSGRHAYFGVY